MTIADIHPLLTDRSRLLIMSTLAGQQEEVDFSTLVDVLEFSRGNLSVHMRKLEEAGFVEIKKSFVDRKPRTTFLITSQGRKEVKAYLQAVRTLLDDIE